jgi:hypothetical protein
VYLAQKEVPCNKKTRSLTRAARLVELAQMLFDVLSPIRAQPLGRAAYLVTVYGTVGAVSLLLTRGFAGVLVRAVCCRYRGRCPVRYVID